MVAGTDKIIIIQSYLGVRQPQRRSTHTQQGRLWTNHAFAHVIPIAIPILIKISVAFDYYSPSVVSPQCMCSERNCPYMDNGKQPICIVL